jgi:hypothetical protein
MQRMKQRIKEDAYIRLWKTFLQHTTNELNDLFQQLQQEVTHKKQVKFIVPSKGKHYVPLHAFHALMDMRNSIPNMIYR